MQSHHSREIDAKAGIQGGVASVGTGTPSFAGVEADNKRALLSANSAAATEIPEFRPETLRYLTCRSIT
jgi:hypothetical protein